MSNFWLPPAGLVPQKDAGGRFLQTVSAKVRALEQCYALRTRRHTTRTGAERNQRHCGSKNSACTVEVFRVINRLLRCPTMRSLGARQLLTAAPTHISLHLPQAALICVADNSRAAVNHTNLGSKSAKKVKKKSTPCGVLFFLGISNLMTRIKCA